MARCGVLFLLVACPPVALAGSGSLDDQVTLEWAACLEPGITGYKLYYGTQSGAYTQILDVGDNPGAGLSGLIAGTSYFCNVTAYNSSGLESPFSEEFSFVYEAPVVVTYAAEQLVLLGAATVQGPAMLFDFEISMQADYLVWCRLRTLSPDSETLLVSVDGGPEEVFQVPAPLSPDWVWIPINVVGGSPRAYSLVQGTHALTITLPATALLDCLVLTSDPNFRPPDDLPRSGEAVVITSHPSSCSIAPGDETTFSVTAVATGPVSYQWRKNNQDLPGATTRELTISAATTGDAGDYSVVVSSGSAARQSGAAVLRVVNTPPGLRVNRLSVAAGGVVTFDVQGEAGASLEIFASSDLITWQSIGAADNSNGTITIADPQALSQSRRFYYLAKAVGK